MFTYLPTTTKLHKGSVVYVCMNKYGQRYVCTIPRMYTGQELYGFRVKSLKTK